MFNFFKNNELKLLNFIRYFIVSLFCLIEIFLTFDKSLTRLFIYISIIFFIIFFLIDKRKENFILKYPLLILFSTFFVSLFFSTDFYYSQKFFFSCFISYILLFLMSWYVIDDFKKIKFLFFSIIVSLFLVCLNCIYQYIVGMDFFRNYQPINDNGAFVKNALIASFGHYNQLGEFLGSILLGLIFYITFSYSKKQKIFFTILFLMPFSFFILTFSRGSWLSLFLSMAVILLFILFVNKEYKKSKFIFWWFFVISFLFIVYFLLFPQVLNRFKLLVKLESAGRYSIWVGVIKTFLRYPLFGAGFNRLSFFIEEKVDAHNIWLKVLGDTGIVGFLGFIFFWIFYFLKVINRLKYIISENKPILAYVFFFFSIVIFIFIHNFTDVSILDGWDLGIYFWLNSGILLKSIFIEYVGK